MTTRFVGLWALCGLLVSLSLPGQALADDAKAPRLTLPGRSDTAVDTGRTAPAQAPRRATIAPRAPTPPTPPTVSQSPADPTKRLTLQPRSDQAVDLGKGARTGPASRSQLP
ncbi:MAG: hypothetical protein KDE22_10800, partial [Rhodobacterales bacterium]|nr:hypothetical protein [Rhodobacterales bacterium]